MSFDRLSLKGAWLFSSVPHSLVRNFRRNPQVQRLAERRSVSHLRAGYRLWSATPREDRCVADVVMAYVYLVAIGLREPAAFNGLPLGRLDFGLQVARIFVEGK